ncbi:hypothetical protein D3C81_1865500 [compost metagenome]
MLVVRANEVQTILVFSVKHVAFHVRFEARILVYPHDDAVTQDSHRSIVRLFVAKTGGEPAGLVRIRAAVVDLASATPVQIEVCDVAALDDAVYRPSRQVDQLARVVVGVSGELAAARHSSP